jgi:hypothetical protein
MKSGSLQAKQFATRGAHCGKGFGMAWQEVRPGLTKLPPKTKDETLRQHLFYNPHIKTPQAQMWRQLKPYVFIRGLEKGVNRIKHLWDNDRNQWLGIRELCILTGSQNLATLRVDIIGTIPWRLDRVESIKERDWLTLDELGRDLPEEFYQVHDISPRQCLSVHIYRRVQNTERLERISGARPILLPTWKVTSARTILKSPKEGFTHFNPLEVPSDVWPVYVMCHGCVKDLPLNFKEWEWARAGHIKQGPFFSYTTKKGYKILNIQQGQTPHFIVEMTRRGYNSAQCKKFYKELWHKWVPTKISTIVWLTCQKGLPLAQWRMRLGPCHT